MSLAPNLEPPHITRVCLWLDLKKRRLGNVSIEKEQELQVLAGSHVFTSLAPSSRGVLYLSMFDKLQCIAGHVKAIDMRIHNWPSPNVPQEPLAKTPNVGSGTERRYQVCSLVAKPRTETCELRSRIEAILPFHATRSQYKVPNRVYLLVAFCRVVA